MRHQLRERRQRFGRTRVGRNVSLPEGVGHRRLPDGGRDGLARGVGKRGGVAGKARHVVAHAGDGDIKQEQVGGGIARHHRQHLAEQRAVGQQCGGDIDRVGGGGEAGQAPRQRGLRGIGQRRQRQPARRRRIGGHHAARAGVADDHQPPPLRLPAAQVHRRAARQRVRIVHAPDAMALQKGIDRAVLVGDGAGVRRRGALPVLRASGLDRHHRHVARPRHARGLGEYLGVGQAFQVQQHQPHAGIMRHRQRQLAGGDVGLVAGGMHVAHADALAAQQPVDHRRHAAALADHGNRAVLRRHLDEHGRKAGDGAAAEVGQPLAVGTDQPQPAGARGAHHLVLLAPAFGTGFAEARCDHDGRRHAQPRAVPHGLHGGIAGDDDDRELWDFRQRVQRGTGAQALDGVALGVDRVERAGVAVRLHVVDGTAADLVDIVGGADHGDGAGSEQGLERVVHDWAGYALGINRLWRRML
ncbi:hypothetical protein D9M70_358360 [compost metagenome]